MISTQNIFPVGRCYVHQCGASPYNIAWTSSNCFQIVNQPCVDLSKYTCCQTFETLLHKIVFPVNPSCKGSLVNFTIDGVVKGGGITFDIFSATDAELRISSMTYNMSTAIGLTMCLNLKNPCPTMSSFIANSQVAFFDTGQHYCCPTCDWYNPYMLPYPPGIPIIMNPPLVKSPPLFLLPPPTPPPPVKSPPTPPPPVKSPPTPPPPVKSPPTPPPPVKSPPTPTPPVKSPPTPLRSPPVIPLPVKSPPTIPLPIKSPPTPPLPLNYQPPPFSPNTCGLDSDLLSCKTLASLGYCDVIKMICPYSCGCACSCAC